MLVSFGAESTRSNEGHTNRKGRQKDTRRQRKVLVAKWLDLFKQKFGASRDELFRKPGDENDRAHAFPCAHFVEKSQAESLPPTKQDLQAILEREKGVATLAAVSARDLRPRSLSRADETTGDCDSLAFRTPAAIPEVTTNRMPWRICWPSVPA